MKLLSRLIYIAFISTFSLQVFAQTALPTSWDCQPSTLPNGWTTNITSYYTSASYVHSVPNAIKFDATGIYLTINFVDEPDTLIYYLRGASFAGGLFTIQQSINGSVWDSVRTFTDANIPSSSLASAVPFKNLLASGSRFVRFYYTTKSGGNVDVDDITITKHAPGPNASIKIKLNNSLIPNGTLAVVGNAPSTSFTVVNSGTDSVLHVTSANLSGTDAGMFSVSNIPLNVPALDSATFTVNFASTGADGSKKAILSLANSDADNTPYVLNLWGVKGSYATEPTSPAANLNFTNLKSYTFRVNFADGGSVPDRYIVLKKSSPITEVTLDGQTYMKGDYIGNAQVCYEGPAGNFYPANVVANTHYYIKVIAVNGYSGYENYLTSTVASRDTTTLATMMGGYYDGVNFSLPTWWQDLHNLVNAHTTLYYSDYTYYMINEFESRDTVVGGASKKVLTCAYSGENYVYTPPFAFTVYSREHVFCESWMPTYNDAGYSSSAEFSDYHNLMPVDQNKINVYRLNYPLGKVVTVQYQYLNGKKGLDSLGRVVFEPRDEVKGDCARAMFYEILCYDGVSGNDWYLPQIIDTSSIDYGQDEQLLKKWNAQDPPDNYEIARNDFIYSIQFNRNPYIDHPDWANWVGFGVNSSVKENNATKSDIEVFPNPTSGKIRVSTGQMIDATFDLYNQTGVRVFSTPLINSKTLFNIDISELSNGMYFYKVTAKGSMMKSGKLVVIY